MNYSLKSLLLVCLITLATGCSWFGSKHESAVKPAELMPLENKIQLNVVKKVSIGNGSIYNYVKLSPFVIDDLVFAASRDGSVNSYDLNNGEQLWEVSVEAELSSGPYVANNMVYLCDSEGNVISFDMLSGKQHWKTKLTSEILSRAVESDGYLIVRTADGSVFALDANTGVQKWVFDRSLPVLTLRGTSDPVIVNGVVYVGLDNGKLVALDLLSGSAIWESQVAIGRGRSEVERMIDIDGTPVIYDGKIYLASYRSKLGAYSIRDGREFWSRDLSSYTGVTVDINNDANALFLTDDEGDIWAISTDSGASLWKQTALHARKNTQPAIIGEYVVVADLEGYMHFLDKKTGEIIARVEVFDSVVRQPPVIYKEYILLQNEEGQVAVIKISE